MRKYPLAVRACTIVVCGCAADGTSTVDNDLQTTTSDGSEVNENHYADKDDVYLDGGPGANAPAHAAALPPGDYYFQVTDTSGKKVLSSDDISCRKFRINANLVIDHLYPKAGCTHATGIDQDHHELGAITIGLAPFADSKNGVYKAWVTPVGKYADGFVHKYSKTDNFKIGAADGEEAPTCGDGHVDSGEACDDGNTANNDGCSSTCVVEDCPHNCPDGSHD